MNTLLGIGLLMIAGYIAGKILKKVGLPEIIGYIVAGIAFSPNTTNLLSDDILKDTSPIMEICLAFIAFEVGGTLKWSKIKMHSKGILWITLFASLFPFIIVASGIFVTGLLIPAKIPFDPPTLLFLSILLGTLSAPTDPSATFAVLHQYNAHGKVSDTLMGIVALDDALGIVMFSITMTTIYFFSDYSEAAMGNPLIDSIYQFGGSVFIGIIIGYFIKLISNLIKNKSEGQFVVIVFSALILSVGLSRSLQLDEVIVSITMGIVVANVFGQQRMVFKILERYTEELIFLFFFILSGLHLDISVIPSSILLILVFIILRAAGKFAGATTGSLIAKESSKTKYLAGGLIPQGGIVIGLVLSIYKIEAFREVSEILLTTIMGATVINELLGPLAAKYTLLKTKEISDK